MDRVKIHTRKEVVFYWDCPHCDYQNDSYDWPVAYVFDGQDVLICYECGKEIPAG